MIYNVIDWLLGYRKVTVIAISRRCYTLVFDDKQKGKWNDKEFDKVYLSNYTFCYVPKGSVMLFDTGTIRNGVFNLDRHWYDEKSWQSPGHIPVIQRLN